MHSLLPAAGIILLGIASFVLAFGFDLAALKNDGARSRLLAVGAAGAGLLAHGAAACGPALFPASLQVTVPGTILTGASLYLLYRSLYAELPAGTYRAEGHGPREVVRTGTYALCRHPGFLWYCGALAGLFLLSRSQWLLCAAPFWITADLGLAAAEDRLVFPRLLAGYDRYRLDTPFLLPNRRSLSRFFKRK